MTQVALERPDLLALPRPGTRNSAAAWRWIVCPVTGRAPTTTPLARIAILTADRVTFIQAVLAQQAFASLTQSGALQFEGDEASWTGMLTRLDSPDPRSTSCCPDADCDPHPQD